VPGVAASGRRLVLMILAVTALLSSLIDDAAAVAIMIPIAVSVARFAASSGPGARSPGAAGAPRMATAACLAVLYGSAAGGMATPAGVPFNPLTISLLDQLTGYRVSFVQWMATGVLLALAVLPVYYLVLVRMSPPEVGRLPGGRAHFRAELARL